MLPYFTFKNGFSFVQKCFVLVLFLFSFLANVRPCLAQDIPVELVWKFKDAGWIGVRIEEGKYQVTGLKSIITVSPGSLLECAWGGLGPIVRLNDQSFEIWRGKQLEIKAQDSLGFFKILTPDGKAVRYRGSLLLEWKSDHWSLINRIDREDYLKGVVPIEMSNLWARDGLEALKAQAVAARTFVVKKLQTNSKITDSPDIDQAYLGKEVEGEATRAIYATEDEILADDQTQAPIDALYSSHNGGYTEKAENVWNNTDPHYSSHPDPFSNGIGGAADRWRYIVGADILGKTFQLGPIQSVQLDKYPSGRVRKVSLKDQLGNSKEVSGRTFVQAFYPFGHPINAESFLGILFEVQEISIAAKSSGIGFGKQGIWNPYNPKTLDQPLLRGEDLAGSTGPRLDRLLSSSLGIREIPSSVPVFIFQGRGWGHGVGMSQWGAYHMAQLGYSYREILSFYYDEAAVRKTSG